MTEQPPAPVIEDLGRLQTALATAIHTKTESNLLVGTWNVRGLGDLTNKWLAGPKDSPKRDWHAIACLAEILSRFDVVAVHESRRNPAALRRIMASRGEQWQVIVSDVTEGAAANGERLAFLYDSSRIRPSGLVGELVLPPIGDAPAASSPAPRTRPASHGPASSSPSPPSTCCGARTRPSGCRRSPRSPNGCMTGRSGPTSGTPT